MTPSVEWDTRDDMFTPHRGVYLCLAYQTAFEVLPGRRRVRQGDRPGRPASCPLGGGTLAANVRLGTLWLAQRGPDNPPPDAIDVPIAVRFFAGGRVSHRAFPTDGLGIPGYTLAPTTAARSAAAGSCSPTSSGASRSTGRSASACSSTAATSGARSATSSSARCAGAPGSVCGSRRRSARSASSTAGSSTDGTPSTRPQESPGELFVSFGNPF